VQVPQIQSLVPGPREARSLQVVLIGLGFVGVIGAALATTPIFVWVSTLRTAHPWPFPIAALLGLVLPFASIGLGAWAWRGRRVRRLVSGYAMGAGVVAFVIVGGMAAIAFVLLLFSASTG
jgi:hypothetical protein